MTVLLRTEGVRKAYGGVHALDTCTVEVEEGSVAGLIGPNGSGKTTLFNGIAGHHAELAGTLSYGQRKLLELAYVLVADPAVVLLDEPAGGVNLSLVNHIADRIRELNAAGKTFLIVEHNMEFVMGLCDRVTVLDSGTVVASGPPGIIRTDRRVLKIGRAACRAG